MYIKPKKTAYSSNYYHFGRNWLLLLAKNALLENMPKNWAGTPHPYSGNARMHWKVYSNWRTKNFWLRFSLKLTRDGILENRKQGKIWQFWTLHLTCFLYYPWSEACRRGEVSQEIEVGDASGDVKLLVMANQIIFKFISKMVDFKVKEKTLSWHVIRKMWNQNHIPFKL